MEETQMGGDPVELSRVMPLPEFLEEGQRGRMKSERNQSRQWASNRMRPERQPL